MADSEKVKWRKEVEASIRAGVAATRRFCMTSWPGQPAPPKRRQVVEQIADSKKRTLVTDQEIQAEAVKIARLLTGLTVGQARAVLQTCGDIICSTVVLTASDVAEIAAEFQGASER